MSKDGIRADTRTRLALERKQLKFLEQVQGVARELGQTELRLESFTGDGKALQQEELDMIAEKKSSLQCSWDWMTAEEKKQIAVRLLDACLLVCPRVCRLDQLIVRIHTSPSTSKDPSSIFLSEYRLVAFGAEVQLEFAPVLNAVAFLQTSFAS